MIIVFRRKGGIMTEEDKKVVFWVKCFSVSLLLILALAWSSQFGVVIVPAVWIIHIFIALLLLLLALGSASVAVKRDKKDARKKRGK